MTDESMKGLKGRVAVITGGASGIGAGLVQAFAGAGVKVVSADIQEEAGRKIISDLGPDCEFVSTDLRVDAHIDGLVARAVERFGGIDFLINAACTYADEGVETDRDGWRNGFDVNMFGHIALLQKSLEHLRVSTGPSVVYFTSESARVGLPGRWVYPATKAALEQLTRSAAMDLANDGIRVNSVMPGWTEKPWHLTAPDEIKEHYKKWGGRLHMLDRQGTLSEVANVVMFLCSDYASFVTGACYCVDGGHSAMGPQGREQILPTAVRKAASAD